MLRLVQSMRANARNQCIVSIWPRLGCKLLAQKPVWRLSHTKYCHAINWLVNLSRCLQWLTSYKTVTLIAYPRRPVVVPEGGRQSVVLGGIMLRSTVFLSAIGAASVLALLCFPASADEAADVQALKQEVAALQKKLNVLDKQEQVDRAQQQAAIQSWETLTSGKDPTADPPKPAGIKFTFGGFAEVSGVYRDKDLGTVFGSVFPVIPFNNSQAAHVNQLDATAQGTRLSLLAEGNIDPSQKWTGYLEFDFLGAAPTANSRESNSYTPRLRQAYGTYDTTDGWHFLIGQSWSLVTMFKEGLIARKENVPLTIDHQYVPGFDWLRNPEIRIVKDWDKQVWLGIEAAAPNAITQTTNGIGLAGDTGSFQPAGTQFITNMQCNSQWDPNTSCSLDFMPDITTKLALDPGWGHYEVFGLARGFRNRVTGTAASPTTFAGNNEAVGFSGGGGAILPLWGDKLQLQGNVLYGQGIGRYDAAQLFDFTVNSRGEVDPLTGYSIMAGITSHNAIKDLDLYAYAGENHIFNHFGGSFGGFGNPANVNLNSGCDILNSAVCSGTTGPTIGGALNEHHLRPRPDSRRMAGHGRFLLAAL